MPQAPVAPQTTLADGTSHFHLNWNCVQGLVIRRCLTRLPVLGKGLLRPAPLAHRTVGGALLFLCRVGLRDLGAEWSDLKPLSR